MGRSSGTDIHTCMYVYYCSNKKKLFNATKIIMRTNEIDDNLSPRDQNANIFFYGSFHYLLPIFDWVTCLSK